MKAPYMNICLKKLVFLLCIYVILLKYLISKINIRYVNRILIGSNYLKSFCDHQRSCNFIFRCHTINTEMNRTTINNSSRDGLRAFNYDLTWNWQCLIDNLFACFLTLPINRHFTFNTLNAALLHTDTKVLRGYVYLTSFNKNWTVMSLPWELTENYCWL